MREEYKDKIICCIKCLDKMLIRFFVEDEELYKYVMAGVCYECNSLLNFEERLIRCDEKGKEVIDKI